MDSIDIAALVSKGAFIRNRIAELKEELGQIEQRLIEQGKGKYTCETASALVVHQSAGSPTFKLSTDNEEKARALAGESFAKLFDRKVTHSPCKGFADVAPKLLTPAKARQLVELCAVPGKPATSYVKWS